MKNTEKTAETLQSGQILSSIELQHRVGMERSNGGHKSCPSMKSDENSDGASENERNELAEVVTDVERNAAGRTGKNTFSHFPRIP